MADNTTMPLGTEDGDTYASDDIGGVKYQRVKLVEGADGVNDGDISAANPLPVAIISGAGSGGTASNDDADFTAGTTAGTPAMGVYEASPTSVTDGDLGTVGITQTRSMKVSDATAQGILTTIDADTGGILTAVQLLDNAISGSEMQVDVITMPTVAVTQSGTWDEVGINDSGNSITVDNAQLSVVGTGTEAAAMRVTIATDSTGVLSVDDNGGSLTVDGTVTANAGTNLNTSTLALEAGGNLAAAATSLAALDNCISGNEAQVDVVAALPAGNNNIGDVDVASIAAGDNNIGNVDVLTLPSPISGPGNPTIDSYTPAAISTTANTANQVLVSSAPNKQIWVYGIQFTLGTADGTVSFQDEDDTAKTGVMEFTRRGGMSVAPSGNFAMPMWKLATDKDLEVDCVTCDIEGSIQYAIVSV